MNSDQYEAILKQMFKTSAEEAKELKEAVWQDARWFWLFIWGMFAFSIYDKIF